MTSSTASSHKCHSAVTAVPAADEAETDRGFPPTEVPLPDRFTVTGLKYYASLSEEQIQSAVFQHLDRRRAKGVIAWHPKNGGIHQATARQRMINARQGVLPGIPDVQLFRGGQLYCLELKTLKGRLTPEQQSLGHLFREQGAITGVAFGLIEALAWLERHKLLEGRTI